MQSYGDIRRLSLVMHPFLNQLRAVKQGLQEMRTGRPVIGQLTVRGTSGRHRRATRALSEDRFKQHHKERGARTLRRFAYASDAAGDQRHVSKAELVFGVWSS